MIPIRTYIAFLVAAFTVTMVARTASADLILTNGKIVTVVDSPAQVEALAVRGDRIVAIGSQQAIVDQWSGTETRIIDLKGRLAIPGFIEGHGHFLGLGDSLMILDFAGAPSWRDIVRQVVEASEAAGPGVWIRGRGWHQDKWREAPRSAVEGLPTHRELSELTPNNPVILTHASGHAAFVNKRAMELAGIDADTPDPPGGEILRDGSGQPTGFLRESAQTFARIAMGRSPFLNGSGDRRLHQAALAAEQCLRHGVTSFHDAGASFSDVDFFKKLASEGRLPVRLWVMLRASYPELARRLEEVRTVGFADHRLTVQAIKLSLDGALGSRGAWLLEPYSDALDSVGLNLMSLDALRRTAVLAAETNFQLCVHAIGDRANREVLDIFEQTFLDYPARKDRRWRIEHAQHLHVDDIPRFGRLNVIASVQGVHCVSDGTWVPDRLGAKRARTGAYVWRDLARSGALIVNGTDVPVEPINPIRSFFASVTRRLSNGTQFYAEQRMTRIEALRSYTVNAARSAFEEKIKGTLVPGMLADIVVLSKDILTCSDEDILKAKVDMTILGGQTVYSRKSSGEAADEENSSDSLGAVQLNLVPEEAGRRQLMIQTSDRAYQWRLRIPERVFCDEGVLVGHDIHRVHTPVLWKQGKEGEWHFVRENHEDSARERLKLSIEYSLSIQPAPFGASLRLRIKNTSQQPLHNVTGHICLGHLSESFRDPHFERTFIRHEAKFLSLTQTQRGSDPIRAHYAVRNGRPIQIFTRVNRFWGQLSPELADNGLIMTRSKDDKQVIALWFEPANELFQNSDEPNMCIHSDPAFGDLEAGESKEVMGKLILFHGGLDSFEREHLE